METPEFPDLLPDEVEKQLTLLLERWAHTNRLPVTSTLSIREAVQEHNGWDQQFWARMNSVLMHTTALAGHIQLKQWGLALPLEADLRWIASQATFADSDYRPYLSLSTKE